MSDVVATGILNIQAQVDTGQLQTALNNTNASIVSAASKTASQIQAAHEKAFTGIGNASKKLAETVNKGLDFGLEAVTSTFKVLGEVGVSALAGVAEEVLRTGVELNNATAQANLFFNAFTGNADAAKSILEEINKTAENNPLFSKEVQLAGARQLAASGESLAKIPTTLNAVSKAIGAVGGSAGQVQQVISVLSRVNTVGLLSTRQFVALKNSGIDAAKVIGQQLGLTAEQVQTKLKAGFLTGRQAADALVAGLQKQFGGLDETIGKTLPQATGLFRNSLAELGGVLTKAFVSPTGGGAAVNLFNSLAAAVTHLKDVAGPLSTLLQPIADDLTKAADAVNKFIQGITSQQVAKFTSTVKDLAPVLAVVAGLFSSLATEALRTIPGIGAFIPGLGQAEAAFIALALAIPQVREQVIRVGEALALELRPVIAALIPAIKDAENAIGALAKPIGDVLVNTIKDVAPSLTEIINLIRGFINVISPIATAVASFEPIKAILEVLIIKFALTKLGVLDFFGTIASKAAGAASALRGVSSEAAAPIAAAGAGAAGAEAGAAVGAAGAVAAGSAASVSGLSVAFRELGASVKTTVADIATFGGASKAAAAAQAEEQAAIQANIGALQAKAAAEQEAIGFVSAETEAELINAEAQLATATAAETSAGIMVAAKAAVAGLAGALAGLASPINIAIAGFLLYNKIVGDAKKKTDELFAAQTQGLGNSLADQSKRLSIANNDLADAVAKESRVRGGILNLINPLNAGQELSATKAREAAEKNLGTLQTQSAVTKDILSNVGAQTGKSAEDIIKIAQTLPNVDIFKTDPKGEKNVINAIVTAVKGGAGEINAANNSILQTADDVAAGIAQNIAAAVKPINELLTGENAVREATQGVKDANFQLNDLKRQQKLLVDNIAARENEIAQANFKVVDANIAIRDLQQQRAEAVRSEQEREVKFSEEQAGFADKLLSNQIDQRKAAQDIVDAQRQLNFLTRQRAISPQGLNLAGLSIDEARRRIANVTSNLANQQANNQQASLTRQVAEAQDAVTSSQIKQRDTTRQSVDLQISNGDAIHANDIALRDFAQNTAKFNEDLSKAQLAQKVAIEDQNNLLSGQIGTQQTLFSLNHQIEGAQRGVTAAVTAQKLAQDNLALTIATQNGDVQGMVTANAKLLADKLQQAAPGGADEVILSNYNKQLGVLQSISAEQAAIGDTNRKNAVLGDFQKEIEASKGIIDSLKDKAPSNIVRASEQATLVSVLNQLKPFIQNAQGVSVTASLGPKNISDLASAAIDELVKNPTSDFHQILKAILSNIGLQIPGFAEGGLITSERLIRAGEQNRMEAILPLTKPANLQNLLSRPEILNPILAALPRISLPEHLTVNSVQAATTAYGMGGPSNANARIDQENSEDRMARKIARALADEMQQRQLGNVKIDAPVTVTPHKLQSENDIANAVAREILRKLR